MQSVSSRIWTRVTVSISYNDNHYTTGTSKLADRFHHSFLEWSFPRNNVKLNESRLLKFYQVKRLKENSTENSAGKNFKEDSQFNELWNISTKLKKKRKILEFKELCFLDTLSDKFLQIVLKICNTLSFLFLSFSFLLYKIPF